MLYDFHEMNRLALSPLTYAASLISETFTNPFSPYSYALGSKRIAARFDLFYRLNKEYEKPEWMIDEVEINGKAVSVEPEVIVNKPFCNLVHFKRSASKNPEGDPTVLIVAPYSGHHATLLRDTVRRMLTDFDVYITDWLDARNVPVNQGSFDLEDYVYYMISFLHSLNKRVHVMAVCQPAVPVMGAVSLMAAQNDPLVPLSMILMGGPIDTRQSPTVVNDLADRHTLSWFETQMIQRVPMRYRGGGRLVYPGFMQLMGFVAMNPRSHMKSHYQYYLDLMRGNEPEAAKHRSFYDEYNAVADLPAEFYLQTVKVVFQDHDLPLGRWHVGKHRVDPSKITTTALLTVEGELDDITGIGQTSAALDLTPNIPTAMKKSYIAEGSGHYGIFSGSRWRNTIFPVVADFINEAQSKADEQLLASLRAEVEAAIRREEEARKELEKRRKAQIKPVEDKTNAASKAAQESAQTELTELIQESEPKQEELKPVVKAVAPKKASAKKTTAKKATAKKASAKKTVASKAIAATQDTAATKTAPVAAPTADKAPTATAPIAPTATAAATAPSTTASKATTPETKVDTTKQATDKS